VNAGARAVLLFLAAIAGGAPLAAHLVGGTPETRSVVDPAAEVARKDAGPGRRWIAWRVPAKGDRTVGCFNNWTRNRPSDCGCSLSREQHSWGSSDSFPQESGDMEIYASVEAGRVASILLASESCAVSMAGERVTILDGADPVRGIALLAGLARKPASGKGEDLAEKALAAIAHHSAREVPAAPQAIVAISREATDPDQRAHALFWLSQTDEPRRAQLIRTAITSDPDAEVREQGVFALSQLDDATDQLLSILRESKDQRVKRQALFWLGQSDDPRALAEIERVLLQ
jgi:hypothetical protein